MRYSDFMTHVITFFTPHRPSHYVTKPAFTIVAFLGFFLLLDFVAQGETTVHGIYDLLIIAAVQLPFTVIAFTLLIYLARMQDKLADLAMTDMLTGLPNRRRFTDQAGRAILAQTPGFMLIVDADHFKRINDTYGHAVGDLCLQAISERLQEICKPKDIRGRIGGEEFGAFLADRSEEDITEIGRRLAHQFRVEGAQLDEPLRFTLSIGAAEARSGDDLMVLMRRADEALYKAKTTGRAKLVIWRRSLLQPSDVSAA